MQKSVGVKVSEAGQCLIKYIASIVPFTDGFPKDTELYRLNDKAG